VSLFESFVAFLVWLSADPAAVDVEAPRAAAAVAAARASMATEPAPPGPPAAAKAPACPDGQCVRVAGASPVAVRTVAPAGGR
jgi:hypothetical protein